MKKILMMIVLLVFLFGCAGIPVRPALQENINASPGKIEGNQYTGIRYLFNVSVPPHWILTTEFPDFLEEMGYDRPFSTDKEQTELYAYNSETKSNILFTSNMNFSASFRDFLSAFLFSNALFTSLIISKTAARA